MKTKFSVLLLILTLPAIVFAGDPVPPVPVPPAPIPPAPDIILPTTLQTKVGRMLKITAKTSLKALRWKCFSAEVDLLPIPNSFDCYFVSPTAGSYSVFCWGANESNPTDLVECQVNVVGTPTPDKLKDAIQKAYIDDKSTTKEAAKGVLVMLFRKATTTTIPDASIKTLKQLQDVLHNSANTLLKDELKTVRIEIAKEFVIKFPTDPNATLDDNLRKVIILELNRIADILDEIK